MKIIVASKNPVKINAVKHAVEKVFSDDKCEIEGVNVVSDVSDQPMSNSETLLGAINRCEHAGEVVTDSDFWIGIEGGVEENASEMESFAWIVVKDKNGKVGKARTSTFFVPQQMIDLMHQGKEMGEADDIVFNNENSKQKDGTVGALTKNVITRASYYTEAIILAFIPFVNADLY